MSSDENNCDSICRAIIMATTLFDYESSLTYDSVTINQQLELFYPTQVIDRVQMSIIYLSTLGDLVRAALQKLLIYNSREAITAASSIAKLGIAYAKWNFDALISSGIPTNSDTTVQGLQQVENLLITKFNASIDLILESVNKCNPKNNKPKCFFKNSDIVY